jgi:hypothetical protein
MTSTYSPNLKIELIGTGDQSGAWGDTTNNNLGTLLEQSIAGYVTQAVTDGADTVLTIDNGTSSNGRYYIIELTGTLTAARNVLVPAVNKPYIFFNNTSGGYSVTVKVSGQTGVTIVSGKKAVVYVNSTDVIEVVNAPLTEAGIQTVTNKRNVLRVVSTTSSATITPTSDTADQYEVLALATPATIAAPSGTPTDGQKLLLRIKDSGSSQGLTWTTSSGAYRAVGITLPTSTVSGKTVYIGCMYNAQDSYWDVVGTAQV